MPRVAVVLCLAVVRPWTVSEARPLWTPPIGIPAPSFGIEQATDDNTFTHWVNNTVPCTDTANNGTPVNPRCTIPTTLAAGSIVQVRGGPYTFSSQTWTLNGTQAQPIFVRGPDAGPTPYLGNNASVSAVGSYAIVENLRMRRWTFETGGHHLALRHCQVTDHPGTGGAVGVAANNAHVVIYDCEIARNGPIPSAIDRHGINLYAGGISNVWIVDNHIHHNSGDAIQFCHSCNTSGPPNDGPANVYIGRNEMHEDEENAVNPKEFIGPVVISQNRMWGYRGLGFSGAGEAIRVDDEGLQGEAWILFNDIWDSSIAINAQGAAATGIYVVGNEIHDIVTQSATAIYPVPPDGGSASMRVVNNTLVNVTDGILVGEARSNVIQATGTAIGSSATGCSHNFVQQGTIQPPCSKGMSGDPLHTMNGIHVTGLQANSPAIDAGPQDHAAYFAYRVKYGMDIKFDRAGMPRPAGGAWDRGAFEFPGTMVTGDMSVAGEALPEAHEGLCQTITSLPYTITAQGHYCVAQDLSTAITTGNAITIEADFVTLDLRGHRMSGGAAGPGTQANGIYALNRRNVTIANVDIGGFFRAVFLEDDSGTFTASEGHGIQGVRAAGNTYAGIHVQGRGTVIRDNHIATTGGSTVLGDGDTYGILTEGAGVRVLNNDVTETNPSATSSFGVKAVSGDDVLVIGNRISGTDFGVYFDGATGTYRDNLATDVVTPYVGGVDAGNE